jgi:hypothetical protein
MPRSRRRAGAALVMLLLSGCALTPGSSAPEPPAPRAWPVLRARAGAEVAAGRYGIADRMLADFTSQFPGTAEGADATFWRALYRVDPSNQTASARGAIAVVDSALAMPLDSARRANLLALRRIAIAVERVDSRGTGETIAAGDTAKGDEKSQSDEIQRLKSELAKANAELERIKKRVAQPKP